VSDFVISGDLDQLILAYDQMITGLDLTPLAEIIRRLIIEDNAAARLAGVGADGVDLAPLRAGRPLTPSEIRKRGGTGPPLAPRGEASRSVASFRVEIIPLGDGSILLLGTWNDAPFLHYHVSGYRAGRTQVPIRDIVGVRPECVERIADASMTWLAERLSL
jgi:hypothetical protein